MQPGSTYPDVFIVLAVWTAWLVYRLRRGLFITLLALLPLGLFFVLLKSGDFQTGIIVCLAVPCLSMFAWVDYRCSSRRYPIARATQQLIAETSIFVILACTVVPALMAYLRGVDRTVFVLALGMGIAAALVAAQAERLAASNRKGWHVPARPFQFRLSALAISVTLIALMFVAQAQTGLLIAFVGAGSYWSGFSLLPASRGYRWSGNEYAIDRQRSAAAAAVLLGISLMVLGFTTVAIAP